MLERIREEMNCILRLSVRNAAELISRFEAAAVFTLNDCEMKGVL